MRILCRFDICFLKEVSAIEYSWLWVSLVFVGLGVTSVWLMVSYDPLNPWMANLNEYMSGRIDLMHHYYVTYGANPFGYDFFQQYRKVIKIYIKRLFAIMHLLTLFLNQGI